MGASAFDGGEVMIPGCKSHDHDDKHGMQTSCLAGGDDKRAVAGCGRDKQLEHVKSLGVPRIDCCICRCVFFYPFKSRKLCSPLEVILRSSHLWACYYEFSDERPGFIREYLGPGTRMRVWSLIGLVIIKELAVCLFPMA